MLTDWLTGYEVLSYLVHWPSWLLSRCRRRRDWSMCLRHRWDYCTWYHIMFYYISCSIRSDQIRSDQIRSDQIRSDQIRSDQIMWCNQFVAILRSGRWLTIIRLVRSLHSFASHWKRNWAAYSISNGVGMDIFVNVGICTRYMTWHDMTSHHTTPHRIASHYITLQYSTVQYITVHYITLHYITLHYITLHYITLHYITLHYIALHHKTLHLNFNFIARQRNPPTHHVKPHSGRVPAKGLCFDAGIPGASCRVMELYGLRTLFFNMGSFVLGPGMTSTRSISVAPRPFPKIPYHTVNTVIHSFAQSVSGSVIHWVNYAHQRHSELQAADIMGGNIAVTVWVLWVKPKCRFFLSILSTQSVISSEQLEGA